MDYRNVEITEEIFNSPEYTTYRKERLKIFHNCGVYCIKNTINGHIYIGSSTNLKQRFSDHKWRLRKGIHHNHHLQNAWNKYGEENFEFFVIERSSFFDKILKREAKYIYLYQPEYNNNKVDENLKWFCSEETRQKIGIKSKEKFINNPKLREECRQRMKLVAANNIGRKCSEETRKLISNAKKGKCDIILTPEIIQKIADKNSKPILQYDTNYNFIKEWKSAADAARFYKGGHGNFYKALTHGIKLYNSYWKRK